MPSSTRSCGTRVEHRPHLQLADAEHTDRARDDVREEAVALELCGRGCPHTTEFRRDPRERVHARAPGARGDAGGDAGRRDGDGAGRHPGLTSRQSERLVEVELPAGSHGADLVLEVRARSWVLDKLHAQSLREALGGEVVVRGPQAPAHHDQIGVPGENVTESRREPHAVVGDRQHLHDLDAAATQVRAHEGPVGVARAAVEQLVAAQHHCGPRSSRRHQLLAPGIRMMPRALMK